MAGRRGHHLSHLLPPGDPVECRRINSSSTVVDWSGRHRHAGGVGGWPSRVFAAGDTSGRMIVYVSHRAPAVPNPRWQTGLARATATCRSSTDGEDHAGRC